MLAALASSSLTQPLFGLWSDKRGALWLLPAGIGLAGVGIGLAAVAPSYGVLVILIFLSGLGIAAFHPEGAKFAVFASGRKRASGMSLFNIGGNMGYALGPIIVTPLVLWLGLGPGGAPRVDSRARRRRRRPPVAPVPRRVCVRNRGRTGSSAAGTDDVRAMVILGGVIGLRSVAWFGLLTFVPLWVVSLGNSEADGNRMLSLMLVCGCGRDARCSARSPIASGSGERSLVAQAILTPMILVFVLVGGVVGCARADDGRDLRRRHVRPHDGAEPDVPARARRHGIRALDRVGNGPRRHRGGGARRYRRRGRSRDRADLLRVRTAVRRRPLLLPSRARAVAAPVATAPSSAYPLLD